MAIEVTMRHSDVKTEGLQEYATKRAMKLQEAFPKVENVHIVVDIDVKRHMYMAEVIVQRLSKTVVGVKEFSPSARAVVDTAAARAEKQLRKIRRKASVERVRAAKQAM